MFNIYERCHASRLVAPGHCVVTDHSGMAMRTHFQPHITIVEVHGAIDACNAERLSDYVAGLASPSRALILNLYCVDFFGSEGFRALVRIAETCQRKGVRWALVTSDAVDRLLCITDGNHWLPTTASLTDALQRLTLLQQAWSPPQRITPPEVTRC